MRPLLMSCLAFVVLASTAFTKPDKTPAPIKTGDWPQWRGPARDGISTEKGLLREWPQAGPPLLWDSRKLNGGQSVGTGYSSISISHGRLYTMGDANAKKGGVAGGFLFCLDADTGKEIWKTKIGANQGDGPRCTPTIDGDRVYGLTRQGNLACLKTSDGSIVWQKDFKKDFDGKMMSGWDYSESPTIDGNKLICTPGGKDAILVALDKLIGKVIWKCQSPTQSGAGYASIVKAEVGGVPQYITLMGPQLGIVGVHAETGKFLWNYKKVGNGTANIPTPIVKGDLVLTSTGYNTGTALLKIVPDSSGGATVKEQYFL